MAGQLIKMSAKGDIEINFYLKQKKLRDREVKLLFFKIGKYLNEESNTGIP